MAGFISPHSIGVEILGHGQHEEVSAGDGVRLISYIQPAHTVRVPESACARVSAPSLGLLCDLIPLDSLEFGNERGET